MKVKELFKKKSTIVVCGVALALALGFGWFVITHPTPPRGMSAEQTVAYYFKQYNARNLYGMQSVVYRDITSGYHDRFRFFVYFRLISCEEYKEDAQYYELGWGPRPGPLYDVTTCWVTYDLKYWPFFQGLGGRNTARYYLVKETKDSDWIIVTWGNG